MVILSGLLANASGEAKKGATAIEVKVKGVPQSTTSGSEFLTFGSGSSHQIVLTRAKLRSIRMEKRSGQVSSHRSRVLEFNLRGLM